jgi:hypothetical protein
LPFFAIIFSLYPAETKAQYKIFPHFGQLFAVSGERKTIFSDYLKRFIGMMRKYKKMVRGVGN